MRAAQSPVAAVFRALGDDTRLRILSLLRVREVCVCEFVDLLGISQPAVSEHLRRLRDAGLVQDERRGMWVFYRLAGSLPDFARVALEAFGAPEELEARLRATPPAGSCARSEIRPRSAAAAAR